MIHADWDTPAFSRAALAPGTGPFPHRDFLRVWWRHRAAADDRLLLVEDADCLLPLMVHDGVVQFLGEPDLTDYHSPLGGLPHGAVALLAETLPGAPFRFDSLPAEAADPLQAALAAAGSPPARAEDGAAMVLTLPPTYDEYLAELGKKERHETRRKRRRFAAAAGEPRVFRNQDSTAMGTFAAMHRLSAGVKGDFMTAAMERMFADLHTEVGARIDAVTGEGESPVALGFGFEDGDTYYLYNSCFDPEASGLSPGAVLVTCLVERAIDHGRRTFDLLKGDESYKLRLGARPRPLHTLTGVLGGAA